MTANLLIALGLLLAAGTGVVVAAISFARTRTLALLLLLTGASCWILVALVHVCEAMKLFPLMGWGQQHSPGHYLDLVCAGLGAGLLFLAVLVHAATKLRA